MDLSKETMYERGLVKERYWYEESDPKNKFPNKNKGARQVARNKLKNELYNELKHVNDEEE